MSPFLKLSVVLAGVMLLVHPAVSQSADKKEDVARKIVRKGIKFLGGAKNLRKYKCATFSEKGTYYGMGEGLDYTGKYAIEFPDKFRMEIEGVFTQVFNKDKGWTSMSGAVAEMSKDQVKAMSDQHYVGSVTQMHPLLNKKFTLKLIGDGKVKDQDVAIIKVSSKGRPDVTLSINPKSGALAKLEYMGALEGSPDKKVKYVGFYEEYKTAGKLKYPSKMRMTRAGKKFVEAEITNYKPMEKLDQSLFAKPK